MITGNKATNNTTKQNKTSLHNPKLEVPTIGPGVLETVKYIGFP